MREADRLFLQAVGDKVRQLRLNANLTQEKLAERCELSTNYIGNIERGEQAFAVTVAWKIALGLRCTLSEFFSGVGETDIDLSSE